MAPSSRTNGDTASRGGCTIDKFMRPAKQLVCLQNRDMRRAQYFSRKSFFPH
jgi:hypothetical protein